MERVKIDIRRPSFQSRQSVEGVDRSKFLVKDRQVQSEDIAIVIIHFSSRSIKRMMRVYGFAVFGSMLGAPRE